MGVTVDGTHSPEHVFGEAEVKVSKEYWSKEAGKEVGLRIRYGNGTVSAVRLSPEAAEQVAGELKAMAGRVRADREE